PQGLFLNCLEHDIWVAPETISQWLLKGADELIKKPLNALNHYLSTSKDNHARELARSISTLKGLTYQKQQGQKQFTYNAEQKQALQVLQACFELVDACQHLKDSSRLIKLAVESSVNEIESFTLTKAEQNAMNQSEIKGNWKHLLREITHFSRSNAFNKRLIRQFLSTTYAINAAASLHERRLIQETMTAIVGGLEGVAKMAEPIYISWQDPLGNHHSILHEAACHNQARAVERLIHHFPELIPLTNKDGETALSLAIRQQAEAASLSFIRHAFIENKTALMNWYSQQGENYYQLAIGNGSEQVIEALYNAAIIPNTSDWESLAIAAKTNNKMQKLYADFIQNEANQFQQLAKMISMPDAFSDYTVIKAITEQISTIQTPLFLKYKNEEDNNLIQLALAADRGMEVIHQLLKRGVSCDNIIWEQFIEKFSAWPQALRTPFGWAGAIIQYSSLFSFDALIEALNNLEDINQQDENKRTLLYLAIEAKASPRVIHMLLERGADINRLAHNGFTPFMLAIKQAFEGQISWEQTPAILLEYGPLRWPGLQLRFDDGKKISVLSSLHAEMNKIATGTQIATKGTLEGITKALEASLLLEGIMRSDIEEVKQAIAMAVSPDTILKLGKSEYSTALIEAAKYKHYALIELLIMKNASINLQDSTGKTALHYVLESEGELAAEAQKVASLLIERGANLYLKTDETTTLQHLAEQKVANAKQAALIANEKAYAQEVLRSLCDAAALGNATQIKWLLTKPEVMVLPANDINMAQGSGLKVLNDFIDNRTALHFAAAAGHTKIVKMLVKAGIDINQQDSTLGRT
ncbi:MAG: ankyrin repeat domain-containing protein, partial [Burkholderiales bacterium]